MTTSAANILIFGGTTEGKKVAWLLDQIGQAYVYSTKTSITVNIGGEQISGALNSSDITKLCASRDIKLIIDAAHPFAEELHSNIIEAVKGTSIETIRFERQFTDLSVDKNIRTFTDFPTLQEELLKSPFTTILALTGVQTIFKLTKVWQQQSCIFRILPSKTSKAIADKSGIPNEYLICRSPEKDVQSFLSLISETKADVVLSKESGRSGFFPEKAQAASKAGIPLWVVQKPSCKGFTYYADSLPEIQSLVYKLGKGILKTGTELLRGYTTGSCITAAAKAALITLLQNKVVKTTDVQLPSGESTSFVTYCKRISEKEAECVVVKNAGDDPDITHGEMLGCRITLQAQPEIKLIGGKGIGKVTLPGLSVDVGQPAINPVPREMICNAINRVLEKHECEQGVMAEVFVPNGEKIAQKTFNPKIGIVGGISILGTTGKVEPYSNVAFLASIKEQLKVAKAMDCKSVVLTSGLRSENKIKALIPELPEQAFVHFGNLVGDTLTLCSKAGFRQIYIGLMLGKAIKLAEGHLNTHSKKVIFNANFAAELAIQSSYNGDIIKKIRTFKLANAIPDIIPITNNEQFYKLIEEKCLAVCQSVFDNEIDLKFYLL